MGKVNDLFHQWDNYRRLHRAALDRLAKNPKSQKRVSEASFARGKYDAASEIGAIYYGCEASVFMQAALVVLRPDDVDLDFIIGARRSGKTHLQEIIQRITVDLGRDKLING